MQEIVSIKSTYKVGSSTVTFKEGHSTVSSKDELPEEQKSETDSFCLPYFQAIMFASVIEDAITQLRILGECNNELRITKTMADIATLHAKKYQIREPKVKDDMVGINTKNLGCMQYKLDKLMADRTYFTDVLMETYLELALDRCFHSLMQSNQDVEDKEVYRYRLTEEEAKNRITRRELMKQLRQQRNHNKTVAYDTDFAIDKLKSKVEDAALNTEIRGRYITNWERARTEQHTQTIHDKEEGPSQSISYYRNRADQEHRIHTEVELLVNIFINDTLRKVEHWMNKYDDDMEEIDLKIAIMKNKYQDKMDKRLEMEQMLADHTELMKNWLQFKVEREKAREYKDKMMRSAIVVQSWWRGLLVRLELGPYKPKKKPPPKPAPKKKK
uniref:Dynein regulatory complex protein 9 n=1 Tax=Heliothis virescens TaxID=7102 RepID=A0A2A4IUX8_HELVI